VTTAFGVGFREDAMPKAVPPTRPSATRKPAAAADPAALDPRFAAIAAAFRSDPDVTMGKMMAAVGLKVHGKIFAMFPRGVFVAKLPRARVDELVRLGHGERFDPGHGRPMKEWIAMPGHEDTWLALAREAHRFVAAGATA
jgi:hypothetical protein